MSRKGASFAIKQVVELIIALIILGIMGIVAVLLLAPAGVKEQAEAIIDNPVTLIYENIPCMINCYTKLYGDELAVLSGKSLLNIDNSETLINWFPCNNNIMKLAVLVNEMARWDVISPGNKSEAVRHYSTDKTFSQEVRDLMYNCITSPYEHDKCTNETMTFSSFCDVDDYLPSYNFLPCTNDNTFIEFLDKKSFQYHTRTGKDIENNFVCDASIGKAYNPGYSLCTSDTKSKYDAEDCMPAWITLTNQELKRDGTRDSSEGRCEDFILLYYALFRAINVKPEEMNFTLGVCDLPCPCKKLIERTNLNYRQTNCYAPANLSIKGYNDIEGCKGIGYAPNDDYNGEFIISATRDNHSYGWTVRQNFTGTGNTAYYRNLSLDGNYTNDARSIQTEDGIKTSSNIIVTSTTFLSMKNWPINNGRSASLTTSGNIDSLTTSGKLKNYTADFGFEIKIESLAGCSNNTVNIRLGFDNSESTTQYTLMNGEKRSVKHEARLTGHPYFMFLDDNAECLINYTITPSTAGVIIQDPCYNYDLTNSLTIQQLAQKCEAYITKQYCYDTITNKVSTLRLTDYIAGQNCTA